ncbi:MAG: hypothetical protein ABEJ42_03165 [Halobacteriaceae archaeon]
MSRTVTGVHDDPAPTLALAGGVLLVLAALRMYSLEGTVPTCDAPAAAGCAAQPYAGPQLAVIAAVGVVGGAVVLATWLREWDRTLAGVVLALGVLPALVGAGALVAGPLFTVPVTLAVLGAGAAWVVAGLRGVLAGAPGTAA